MTKRQKLGLVLYAIGLTCAAALYLNVRANPTYRGKTLTTWCEQFRTTATPGPKEEARNAIRAMTLNSLARLVEDLNYDPPDSKKVLRNKLRNSLYRFLPLVFLPIVDKVLVDGRERRAAIAQVAFEALGSDGSQAIPALLELTYERNHQIADRALGVLALLGTNGLNALLQIINDPTHPRQSWAVFHLRETRYLGTNAHPAVCLLVKLALSGDVALDHEATTELGCLGLEPEQSVPALRAVLEARDPWRRSLAAESLGKFGAQASVALPALKDTAKDPDPNLRRAAQEAITRIRMELNTRAGH